MQAESKMDDAPEPSGSWLKTFAMVAVITLLILGGIGLAVYHMSGDNLPMNYPGFDEKK